MSRSIFEVNQVSQFSTDDEVCLALVGKYAKKKESYYSINLIQDIIHVHTFTDKEIEIELPSHYTFKYEDEQGSHIVDKETNKITVKGITSFTCVYK